MTADDRLLYETRVRSRAAVVAAFAGALMVIAAIVQLAGPHTKVDELTLDLVTAHKRFPLDVIGAVYFPGDAHLEPRRFTTVLTRLLRKAGVEFRFNTPVTGWRLGGERIAAAVTRDGESIFAVVVLADLVLGVELKPELADQIFRQFDRLLGMPAALNLDA